MVGSGIASSLVHECGHQAAELLGLVPSLRAVLHAMQRVKSPDAVAWRLWERWISEIIADFWAVANVGITATVGLLGVASLPRIFVFRLDLADPHPNAFFRVLLSCAFGKALYPHPQWDALARTWEELYPPHDLPEPLRSLFPAIERTLPVLVELVLEHRPKALRGKSLREALPIRERQPAALFSAFAAWQEHPENMRTARPSLVFAVIGQARAGGLISPHHESKLIGNALTDWALQTTVDMSAICAETAHLRERRLAS